MDANNVRDFYQKTVSQLITSPKASILVCGGGELDKGVLQNLGYTNVTISNLDKKVNSHKLKPYKWSYQNGENLSFKDNSFGYCLAHASIHHSTQPHKFITEMFRVAKIAVLGIESRDSFLMKFLEKYQISLHVFLMLLKQNDTALRNPTQIMLDL